MPSNIDFSKPIFGHPTTESVRNNFQIAQTEITDLQDFVEEGPFIPVDGGIRMTGLFELYDHPRGNYEPATKQYVDEIAFGVTGTVPEVPLTGMTYARGSAAPNEAANWLTTPIFNSLLVGLDQTNTPLGLRVDATHSYVDFTDPNTIGLNYLSFDRTNKIYNLFINNTTIAAIGFDVISIFKPIEARGQISIIPTNPPAFWGGYNMALKLGNPVGFAAGIQFVSSDTTTPSFAFLKLSSRLYLSAGSLTNWENDIASFEREHVFIYADETSVQNIDVSRTALFRDTVTLGLDPVLDLEAATKRYVDTSFNTNLAQYLQLAGGTMRGGIHWEDANDLNNMDTSAHLKFHSAGMGIGVTTSRLNYNVPGGVSAHVFLWAGTDKVSIDNFGLHMQPGTAITLAADPTTELQAVTKQYVDSQDALYLPLTGGILSGGIKFSGVATAPTDLSKHITLDALGIVGFNTMYNGIYYNGDYHLFETTAGVGCVQISNTGIFMYPNTTITLTLDPPVMAGHATAKFYVDSQDALYLPLTGGRMSGGISFGQLMDNDNNLTANHITMFENGYGFGITGGRLNIVAPQTYFVTSDNLSILYVNAGGIQMLAGQIYLVGDPTSDLAAAPKQYIDNQLRNYLPLSGGTLTGELIIDPQVYDAWGPYVMGERLGSVTRDAGLLFLNSNTVTQAIGILRFGSNLYISAGTADRWQTDIAYFNKDNATFLVDAQIYGKLLVTEDTNFSAKVTLGFPPSADMEATTKLYVDAADEMMEAAISVLAQDLYFVGGINVVTDQGNYTLVVTNPPADAPYPPYPDLSPLPPASQYYKGFYLIVTQGGQSPDPAVTPTNIPYDIYATNDWIVCAVDPVGNAMWFHLGIGQANLIASNVGIVPNNTYLGPNVQTAVNWLDANKVDLTGDTLLGFLTLHSDPQGDMHPASKRYVDARSWNEAPNNNIVYGRKSLGWHQVGDLVSVAGGGIFNPAIDIPKGYIGAYQISNQAGAIGWPGDNPSQTAYILVGWNSNADWTNKLMMGGYRHTDGLMMPLWFATNDNVWELVLTGAGGKLNPNAQFILGKDPVNLLDATTKQYVDRQDALYLPLTGGTISGVLTILGQLSAQGADFWQAVNIHNQFSFNNQMSPTPLPIMGGGYFGWNFSQSAGEINFFNAYNAATYSFSFHQITAEGIQQQVATISTNQFRMPTGLGVAYGGLPGGGSIMGFIWDGRIHSYVDGTDTGALAFLNDLYGYLPLAGGAMSGGITFGNRTGDVNWDVSKHLALWSNAIGIGITGARMNLVTDTNTGIFMVCGETDIASFHNISGLTMYNGRTVMLGADPTNIMHAVTKQYDDRNRRHGYADVSSGAISPTASDMDYAYIYIYGAPLANPTITMPVATTTRTLWTMYNTTMFPVTVTGTIANTIIIPTGGSRAFWTDGAGIYELYNVAETRPIGDYSKFIANTEFVLNQGYMPKTGGIFTGGISFNNAIIDPALTPINDLSKHIALFNGYGFNITSSRLNIITGSQIHMLAGATDIAVFNTSGLTMVTGDIWLRADPTANNQAASKGYVDARIASIPPPAAAGVTSFNTRTGAVTLVAADVSGVGGALLNSPIFTGTPTSPYPTSDINSIANKKYVDDQVIAASSGGVVSFNSRTGAIVLVKADVDAAGGPYLPTTTPLVSSFNTRTGAVTLALTDIEAAGGVSKSYVDAADALMQADIAVLAQDLFFVGGIDVVNDVGRYTDVTGLADGPLPAPGANYKGFFLIVTVGGQSKAGNIPSDVYTPGDWIVCDGLQWFHLGIGQSNILASQVAISPDIGIGANVQDGLWWLVNYKLNTGGGAITGPFAVNNGAGISYDGNNVFKFTWMGSYADLYVDGSRIGTLALQENINASLGNYLPLTGGTVTGPTTFTSNLTVGVGQGGVKFFPGGAFNTGYTSFVGPNGIQRAYIGNATGNTIYLVMEDGVTTFSVSGFLQLGNDPTAAMHGATKQYVDTKFTSGGSSWYLPLGGGTLSGTLIVDAPIIGRNSGGTSNGFVGSYDTDINLPTCFGFWADNATMNFGFADGTGLNPASVAQLDGSGYFTCNKLFPYDQIYFRYSGTGFLTDANYAHWIFDSANWGIRYDRAGGSVHFIRGYDGLDNFTITGDGHVIAYADVMALQGNMFMGWGGAGTCLQFFGGWLFSWNSGNGSLEYTTPSGGFFVARTTDWLFFANFGPFAGHGAYVDLSDDRSKTGVAESITGLKEILQINPIRFRRIKNFKEGSVTDDNEDIGFSAQQIQSVIPEAVKRVGIELPDGSGGIDTDDPTLGIVTTPIVAALVNSVKTLTAMVTKLTDRINVLEGEQHG
jgi:hypothetical protein